MSDPGSRRKFLQLLAGSAGALVGGSAISAAAGRQSRSQKAAEYAPYAPSSGDLTMALAGDAMITRPLTPFREERFLKVRDLLHSADARFANGEATFNNYEDWPMASTYYSRTYMRSDPRLIKDLQWFGINMLSCANNHTGDFCQEGVLTNIRNLDEAEMVHAGSGSNYAEAVAPAYLETSNGRVGLIAATSSSPPYNRAGKQREDMKGRPGSNLIRWINEWTVDREAYDALNRIARQFAWDEPKPDVNRIFFRDFGMDEKRGADAVHLRDRNDLAVYATDPGARFVLGDSFERHTKINQPDLRRNVQSVRDAHKMSEWVIYSIHNHEGGKSVDEPSEHIQLLARAVIDAGADAFVGHGPHRIRGIEIYKGRPIFYSVGNLIAENDTVLLEPEGAYENLGLGPESTVADTYDARFSFGERSESGPDWLSFLPLVSFKNGALYEIRLYPIEMGSGLPRYIAGRPMMSEGQIAAQTLKSLQELSAPFGTKIEIDQNIGVIRAG